MEKGYVIFVSEPSVKCKHTGYSIGSYKCKGCEYCKDVYTDYSVYGRVTAIEITCIYDKKC